MRGFKLIPVLLLGIALAASAFESGGQKSYPVVTAVKGGVKAITNPDYPLWLELYKDEKTKGYTYDVFSPGGIYLKHVKLDQRIYEFKKGKAYSIVRPEEGYPSIKRFRLELAPEK